MMTLRGETGGREGGMNMKERERGREGKKENEIARDTVCGKQTERRAWRETERDRRRRVKERKNIK